MTLALLAIACAAIGVIACHIVREFHRIDAELQE